MYGYTYELMACYIILWESALYYYPSVIWFDYYYYYLEMMVEARLKENLNGFEGRVLPLKRCQRHYLSWIKP